MLKRITTRALGLRLAFIIVLLVAPAVSGQTTKLQVEYTVAIRNPSERLFHVTTDIKNIDQQSLQLSLPTWTPGWYTIENYAKNILRFQVTDGEGNRLPHSMTRRQTWLVNTKGLKRIKVEFDYLAQTLALNQAKIASDYAFFTGTQLFLMPEGHRANPSTIRFEVPNGWNIVSALTETAERNVFTSRNYDTLVDSPTEMGNFDVTRFEVQGKPHTFVATPAGVFSKEKAERFTQMLSKIAATQGAIFGQLPYDKYVYFYFFTQAESNASGGLEHHNSFVAFESRGAATQPETMADLAAHEFFHVWNVKRFRPAELWPYDYSGVQETPSLWVSEGFTNYYESLTLYRAGLNDRERFLASVAEAARGVERNPARAYISPADASVSTWLGYDTPVAFRISYYTQGQNLGALLDLSIIRDSRGEASLDDVMRALDRNYYQKDKGFLMEDLLLIIKQITRKDYSDFFNRYVTGVEVPPYDTILGYAGYQFQDRALSKIVEVPSPTPDQLKVRERWLRLKD